MASFRILTVELRFSEASPEEVARALAPAEIGPDLGDFFESCIVWAGNLIAEMPYNFTAIGADPENWALERGETELERWLTDRLRVYDQIERAVYNYFYDTPMSGYYNILRRSGPRRKFREIETVEYGQGAPYFDIPREYVRESVDYIQAKYGLHLLSHEELVYPRSRAWDFEVERIC